MRFGAWPASSAVSLLMIALRIASPPIQLKGSGGTFGGDGAVYRGRRGVERRLWQFTIVLLGLFVIFSFVSYVLPREIAS